MQSQPRNDQRFFTPFRMTGFGIGSSLAVTAFVQAWSEWRNLDASSAARTDVLGALLSDLTSKLIRQWDIAIQGVFMDDTPEYAELLPNGRGSFQTGAIDDRMQAVKMLAERLGGFAQFAALK